MFQTSLNKYQMMITNTERVYSSVSKTILPVRNNYINQCTAQFLLAPAQVGTVLEIYRILRVFDHENSLDSTNQNSGHQE